MKRPIICHHLNGLHMGGTEKMVQLHLKYSLENDDTFNHVIAYQAQQDRTREPYFREILGENKLIPYASYPEFVEVLKEVQPAILHHYAAGIPEFPMVAGIREIIPNTKLVQTAVFGNQNNQVDLDAVIYVSKHIQHMAEKAGVKNHHVVRNPVEGPCTDKNLREELGISEDAFVFGRIGRDSDDIYDSINVEAFSRCKDDNVHFVIVAPSALCKADIERFSIPAERVHFIDKTTDESRISAFYNTIDVLAHARKDGECNPANMFEAFSHKVPVISHYGMPFNGHIECIGNGGCTVLPGETDEYYSIMEYFVKIKNTSIFEKWKENAYKRWQLLARPQDRAMEQLEIYKNILR